MSQRDIEAVSKGGDPKGFFLAEEDIAPSFANDLVIGASEISGDPDDPEVRGPMPGRSPPSIRQIRR